MADAESEAAADALADQARELSQSVDSTPTQLLQMALAIVQAGED